MERNPNLYQMDTSISIIFTWMLEKLLLSKTGYHRLSNSTSSWNREPERSFARNAFQTARENINNSLRTIIGSSIDKSFTITSRLPVSIFFNILKREFVTSTLTVSFIRLKN